jgi:hypothetical protein
MGYHVPTAIEIPIVLFRFSYVQSRPVALLEKRVLTEKERGVMEGWSASSTFSLLFCGHQNFFVGPEFTYDWDNFIMQKVMAERGNPDKIGEGH